VNIASDRVWVCQKSSPLATLMAPKDNPYAPVATPIPTAFVVIDRRDTS
jgi:hypothetical protein